MGTAATFVDGGVDATTSEGVCEVVDVEVAVVSTMTAALLEVAGTGTAPGVVGMTTWAVVLGTTGEAT